MDVQKYKYHKRIILRPLLRLYGTSFLNIIMDRILFSVYNRYNNKDNNNNITSIRTRVFGLTLISK